MTIRPGDCVAYRPRPAQGWGVVTAVDGDTVTAKFYVGYFTEYTGPASDFELIRRKEYTNGNEREYSESSDGTGGGSV
jgi:hypothetical protein